MSIADSPLSDFIASCDQAPSDIVRRLRAENLLRDDVSDQELVSIIKEALARTEREVSERGYSWMTSETSIASDISEYLSPKGQEMRTQYYVADAKDRVLRRRFRLALAIICVVAAELAARLKGLEANTRMLEAGLVADLLAVMLALRTLFSRESWLSLIAALFIGAAGMASAVHLAIKAGFLSPLHMPRFHQPAQPSNPERFRIF